jgi:hypothetical protein
VRTHGGQPPDERHWQHHLVDRAVAQAIRIVRRLDFTHHDRVEATYGEHAKILRTFLQREAEVRKITLGTLRAARLRTATSGR